MLLCGHLRNCRHCVGTLHWRKGLLTSLSIGFGWGEGKTQIFFTILHLFVLTLTSHFSFSQVLDKRPIQGTHESSLKSAPSHDLCIFFSRLVLLLSLPL
jgi:hypothetical protein